MNHLVKQVIVNNKNGIYSVTQLYRRWEEDDYLRYATRVFKTESAAMRYAGSFKCWNTTYYFGDLNIG